MPLRKPVTHLKDVCIDSIIQNAEFHGEMFKKNQGDKQIYASYKIMQLLFSDALLQRLFVLFTKENAHKNVIKLKKLMFPELERRESRPENQSNWFWLELFFNENTVSVLPNFPPEYKERAGQTYLSKSVLSFITSSCKNLRTMNKVFCSFTRDSLRAVIPSFPNLVEVDLGRGNLRKMNKVFCSFTRDSLSAVNPSFQNLVEVELGRAVSEEILGLILKTCLFIKDIAAHGGDCLTDLFLLNLCKHHLLQEEFIFCPENGKCSVVGKYLERFVLVHFSITVNGAGIACALQHLPVLRSFHRLPERAIFSREKYFPDVFKGILTLQNAALHRRIPPVMLKLTSLYFYKNLNEEELHTILDTCPNLKSLHVDLWATDPKIFTLSPFQSLQELNLYYPRVETLNSAQLKRLLSLRGKQIKALSFQFCHLDLVSINNILGSCHNLRRLGFMGTFITNVNNRDIVCLAECVAKLKNIFLEVFPIHGFPSQLPQFFHYFAELLSDAKSLTHLTIATNFAAKIFVHSMERNDFFLLEDLCFRVSVSERLSDMKMLYTSNRLRKIEFWLEDNSPGIIRYKEFVRKNNFELEIKLCP